MRKETSLNLVILLTFIVAIVALKVYLIYRSYLDEGVIILYILGALVVLSLILIFGGITLKKYPPRKSLRDLKEKVEEFVKEIIIQL